MSARPKSIAVVGIGNSLLTDDGAGIHTLERFAEGNTNDDVFCLDGGTVGLALLDRLSDLDGLVALDAMKLGLRPGTVTVLEGEAMDAHLRNQHGSVHEVGLSDLMDALRLRGDLPEKRALIGIEPEDMDWGTEPTAAVAAALPEAADCAHDAGSKLADRTRNRGLPMTASTEIGVQFEAIHGNVRPILNEVMHAIDKLLDDDIPTTIDLSSLPFGPGELDKLEATLGEGELSAQLDALGTSRIRETTYPGVWWIEHRNVNDEVVGRYLEVTRLPDILSSQDADIMAGRARLEEQFE